MCIVCVFSVIDLYIYMSPSVCGCLYNSLPLLSQGHGILIITCTVIYGLQNLFCFVSETDTNALYIFF